MSDYLNKTIALFLIIVVAPLLLIIAVIIILDDGFPVLYRQMRVGVNNKTFKLIKFRTMKKNVPDIPTHLLNSSNQYFTRSGPYIRRFSIDELPQFINIIYGDMVFVGPRPALHNQNDLVRLRTFTRVHKMMPGLTGWAQINGRDNLSIEEKVRLDEYYLRHKSIILDLKIIMMTFKQLLIPKGVSH